MAGEDRPNGSWERFRAIERDIAALERVLDTARDDRGKLWDRVTNLEREATGIQKDVQATVEASRRIEASVRILHRRLDEAEERRREEAITEHTLSVGQKTAIIAGTFVVLAALVQAIATLIQAGGA